MDAAGKLLYKSAELGEESVSIGKKMLDKLDDTIGEIRGLREDLKSFMEERFCCKALSYSATQLITSYQESIKSN